MSTNQIKGQLPYCEDQTHYKLYRAEDISEKGVVSEEEYKVLQDIFSKLSKGSYFQLFKQKTEIEKLKNLVEHLHPLNFLETLKSNQELKNLFLESIQKYFVRSQCMSSFKEELKNQHQNFKNIGPHLSNFSRKMNLEERVLQQYLAADNLDQLIHHIVQNNC